MKMTVKELLGIKPSLEKLLNLDIPIKTAFKVGKMIKGLNKEYEVFEESQVKLFKKHGKENKEGNLQVDQKKMKAFNKDLDELKAIEIDVVLVSVTLEELGDDIKLSALDLDVLDQIIKE